MSLSATIDAKDKYTSGHSKRVADYSKEIARRLGKSDAEQQEISKGAGSQFAPKMAEIMLSIIDDDANYELHE